MAQNNRKIGKVVTLSNYSQNTILKNQSNFRFNITVEGISSDGDPRPFAAMKVNMKPLLVATSDNLFSRMEAYSGVSCIQDTIHTGLKLRNRLLKPSINLPLGNKQISVAHLKQLVKNVPKNIHGLVTSDVDADDRQNFRSLVKVLDDRVLNSLEKYVIGSEATISYLKMCKNIVTSLIDDELNPLERVFRLWKSVFFLRIWQHWLLNCDPLNKINAYSINDNFISDNAYGCVEINAHALIHLIVKFRNSNKPELFLPTLFSSQMCENAFRQFRSMTSVNWTRINFSMHQLLHMIGRIEAQNDIMYSKLEDVMFPRLQKADAAKKQMHFELPSNDELASTLEKAQHEALRDAESFDIHIMSFEINKCELRINLDTEQVSDESDMLVENELGETSITSENLKDYSEENIENRQKFVELYDVDGSVKLVRKSTIVWLLSNSKDRLSNDRLKRVQGAENSLKRKLDDNVPVVTTKRMRKDGLIISTKLNVDDWCFFYQYENSQPMQLEDVVFGSIVGFKYISGKNERAKQYSLSYAPISCPEGSSERGIAVLAAWYKLGFHNILSPVSQLNSFFIDIRNYIATAIEPNIETNPITKEKKYRIESHVIEKLLNL